MLLFVVAVVVIDDDLLLLFVLSFPVLVLEFFFVLFISRLFVGLNKFLFIHRNHKFSKSVQETQKQYAYLSVTYR